MGKKSSSLSLYLLSLSYLRKGGLRALGTSRDLKARKIWIFHYGYDDGGNFTGVYLSWQVEVVRLSSSLLTFLLTPARAMLNDSSSSFSFICLSSAKRSVSNARYFFITCEKHDSKRRRRGECPGNLIETFFRRRIKWNIFFCSTDKFVIRESWAM